MTHLPNDPIATARKLREQADTTGDAQLAEFLRMLADDYEELAKSKD